MHDGKSGRTTTPDSARARTQSHVSSPRRGFRSEMSANWGTRGWGVRRFPPDDKRGGNWPAHGVECSLAMRRLTSRARNSFSPPWAVKTNVRWRIPQHSLGSRTQTSTRTQSSTLAHLLTAARPPRPRQPQMAENYYSYHVCRCGLICTAGTSCCWPICGAAAATWAIGQRGARCHNPFIPTINGRK
jgi:hypothetical protein